MSAYQERVYQDLRKLQELSDATSNRVRVSDKVGNPTNKITIELAYATAPSAAYPSQVQQMTRVSIELLSQYPLREPSAHIATPIFHPNVYESGKICFGTKWLPTEGLDLLAKRIIKIITFDPAILNDKSPANRRALTWYQSAIQKHPGAFPTDRFEDALPSKPQISWSDLSSETVSKTTAICPGCGGEMRIPAHKKIRVTCPHCRAAFLVSP